MTEKEFWKDIKELRARNRLKLLAIGVIKPDNPEELYEAKCLYGNSADCEELEDLPKNKVAEIGKLLFNKNVRLKAKEMIIMTLAHESTKESLNTLKAYNKRPDKKLKYFAEFALQECEWWNE